MIEKEQFYDWKHNPVTVQVMEFLGKRLEEYNEVMLDDHAVLSADISTLHTIAARRDMLKLLLNLSLDEVNTPEEEDDAEEGLSSS